MKLSFPKLTLAAALATLPAMAQTPPPPASPAPQPPPAAPVPAKAAPAPVPGQPPVPVPAAALAPDEFKTEKERQSYALGLSFANGLKQQDPSAAKPNPAEVIKGMLDVLNSTKSTDYATGANLGAQIRQFDVDVDPEVLSKAVQEALTGAAPRLNSMQAQEAMKRLREELQKKAEAKAKVENEKAEKEAAKFMEANSKAEGVKVAPSGLQYTVLKQGEGKVPEPTEFVLMNLKGTLADGTVVEKNPETGPARRAFRVLPKGLQEGLAMIKVGGKGKFWVPPALGWGETGRGGLIKGHSVLVYEVEVLGTEPMPKQPQVTTPPVGAPPRPPVTAVTPPISVEIPPKPGTNPPPPKPGAPVPPKPPVPGNPAPPAAPPAPPASAPVPVPPPAPPAPPK